MIIFDLICDDQHIFEGWFSSSDDYAQQKQRNLLSCPYCGSNNIIKSVMAPHIGSKSNQKDGRKNNISAGQLTADDNPSLLQPTVQASSENNTPDDNGHFAANSQNMKNDPHINEPSLNAPISKFDDNGAKAIWTALMRAQNEILKKSTWVGDKFTQEVRAIHYGETEKRQIHGQANPNEVRDLLEEGVDLTLLPMPTIAPKKLN